MIHKQPLADGRAAAVCWKENHLAVFCCSKLPKSHGNPRIGGRRVLSGIIFLNRDGPGWRGGEGTTATSSAE
ncbi:MAG: hypothetical protein ACU0BO_20075 [Limimaricola soesokkakensis]|uniref:hypothetical protein n=1 Tax=Limimaricola soesokkakensis TaxID=1343159 RepID=UPI00405A0B2F